MLWDAAIDGVGVASYLVFRDGAGAGQQMVGTTFDDTTVQAETQYTYQVRALDAAGNIGPLSDDLVVQTPAAPDTTPPTVPTLLRTTENTLSRVTLAWNASTDNVRVTGYYVYRGTTRVATTSSLSVTVTGLQSRTTYTFSVRAFDADGNISGSSATVSVRAN